MTYIVPCGIAWCGVLVLLDDAVDVRHGRGQALSQLRVVLGGCAHMRIVCWFVT